MHKLGWPLLYPLLYGVSQILKPSRGDPLTGFRKYTGRGVINNHLKIRGHFGLVWNSRRRRKVATITVAMTTLMERCVHMRFGQIYFGQYGQYYNLFV